MGNARFRRGGHRSRRGFGVSCKFSLANRI
jgi:hypothetical protein